MPLFHDYKSLTVCYSSWKNFSGILLSIFLMPVELPCISVRCGLHLEAKVHRIMLGFVPSMETCTRNKEL